MMQIMSNDIMIAGIFFSLAITILLSIQYISEKAKNVEIIYPSSDSSYNQHMLERELRLKRWTKIWRLLVVGEIVFFGVGGYFLMGILGAFLFILIVGSDYIRNREPLSNLEIDPLTRIVSVLEYFAELDKDAKEVVEHQIEVFIKRRKMDFESRMQFLLYLSNRQDMIGGIANRMVSQ